MPSETFTLRAEGVSFAYGVVNALTEVSLALSPGELVAVVGPNGCGKSTLLRVLIGLQPPDAGRVLVGEVAMNVLPRREAARRIALVPQNTTAPFGYSVREMVLMARYHAHGGLLPTFETADDIRAANEAMWAMDVHHLAARPITTLSGGERQRGMIARALCQNSPIMLLDEPSSSLDLHHQLELFETLHRLVHGQGRAVLIVTHDLNVAMHVAGRTIVMDGGRIVADGKSVDVLVPAVLEPVYRVRVHLQNGALAFERRASA